jgi:mannose-6-phosphate isomerase-like protein (cupin superfamily)
MRLFMEIQNFKEKAEKKVETFPYKGNPLPVKDVWVRWLSQAGPDSNSPDYGLRYFRIGPRGEIPIHKHFYVQTMYILKGTSIVCRHDPETDETTDQRQVLANDFIFVPSMEPHSMSNPSKSEDLEFLCCIANIYGEDQ